MRWQPLIDIETREVYRSQLKFKMVDELCGVLKKTGWEDDIITAALLI